MNETPVLGFGKKDLFLAAMMLTEELVHRDYIYQTDSLGRTLMEKSKEIDIPEELNFEDIKWGKVYHRLEKGFNPESNGRANEEGGPIYLARNFLKEWESSEPGLQNALSYLECHAHWTTWEYRTHE